MHDWGDYSCGFSKRRTYTLKDDSMQKTIKVPEAGIYEITFLRWLTVDEEGVGQFFDGPTYDLDYLMRAYRERPVPYRGLADADVREWAAVNVSRV